MAFSKSLYLYPCHVICYSLIFLDTVLDIDEVQSLSPQMKRVKMESHHCHSHLIEKRETCHLAYREKETW